VTVIPAAPRYLEPVFLRVVHTPYPTVVLYGATVALKGNNLDVQTYGTPEIGRPSDDFMLGRLPVGTYTVTINGGPVVATFTVAPPERSNPALFYVPPVNYSDLWWNPSESGLGITVNQGSTNEVFATWYAYDANGNPVWYSRAGGIR